mgnify:CR=1 FL=1
MELVIQVHVTGMGDFQLKQIDVLEDPHLLQRAHKTVKGNQMQIESYAAEVRESCFTSHCKILL